MEKSLHRNILYNHLPFHPPETMSENHTLITGLYNRTVQELMQPLNSKDAWVEKSDDIEQVFQLLTKKNHVWVVDDNMSCQVVGVITHSDTIELFAPVTTDLQSFDKPSLHSFQYGLSTKAEEIMSKLPITAEPEEKIADVISKMKHHTIKQLAVVDENKRLVGEITLPCVIQEYLQQYRALA
jgi:predicted transcriptional regulator